MIFNARKTSDINFLFNGKELDKTDKYTYLGIDFTPSGKFKATKSTLYNKAMRGFNSYRFKLAPSSGTPIKVLSCSIHQ